MNENKTLFKIVHTSYFYCYINKLCHFKIYTLLNNVFGDTFKVIHTDNLI